MTHENSHQENYQVIEAWRDNLPAIIVLNAGLNIEDGKRNYPWLMTIQLPIRHPTANGLCDRVESERLSDIEDTLLDGIEAAAFLYVGRTTWNSMREVLIYVQDPDFILVRLRSVLESTGERKIRVGKRYDPTWTEYGQFRS